MLENILLHKDEKEAEKEAEELEEKTIIFLLKGDEDEEIDGLLKLCRI